MAAASTAAADDPSPPAACDDSSACSTPFVSAPSSPSRDRDPYPAHFFFSAPTSPTRKDAAISGALDFDFDFSSRFPSPSAQAAAMSSADELFCNGQIRPVRLAAALLQPHPDPAVLLDFPPHAATSDAHRAAAEDQEADERGRVRSRSVRRKARSMSPFRTHWRSASHVPAATPECADEAQSAAAATPAASRSSSSSSTASSASSASSSSSRGSRRWGGFLKDLLHRSKSDGGKTNHHQQHSHHAAAAPSPAAKPSASSPSPSPAHTAAAAKGRNGAGAAGHRGGGRRKMSAHERLYEARRAEAEEMRRRTSLPYRQGLLLFGCIGLGHRSGGAVHGLARGLNAVSSRS